mmetsp:Transcript_11345/g.29942  ORF Transcript_11345/g.29942 Transcript_11345/m.29942 type:complete len:91 (+) Transcript_11345:102-374(+)
MKSLFLSCLLLLALALAAHAAPAKSGAPRSFASCAGISGKACAEIIRAFYPDMEVSIVRDGAPVTADYREDRVRVYVDQAGKVAGTPRTG